MLAVVTALTKSHADLSPLGAGIIAAAHLAIADNSMTFATKLGVAHAIVLRECVMLGEGGWITLTDRGDRSGRLFYTATNRGRTACEAT